MAEFVDRFKEAIRLRNITQNELCQKTKIPKSAMSQYISGKFKPKQTRTYLLAKALDVNEAWLMGYDVPMERENEIGLNTTVKPNTIDLTDHEEKVITAYRDNPDLQPAVDKLLSVPAEEKVYNIKVAARNGEFVETTITDSDLEKIKNLPDADGC